MQESKSRNKQNNISHKGQVMEYGIMFLANLLTSQHLDDIMVDGYAKSLTSIQTVEWTYSIDLQSHAILLYYAAGRVLGRLSVMQET